MKIFVSWSGPRSQQLAQYLRDWTPLVLHFVEPWLSDADLGAGERWGQKLAKELETSNFGIVCITRENLTSPWILFESGALAKSLEGSRVIPVLLGLEFSEISGPLAQFQAKKADRAGLSEVIHSINQVAPEPVPEDRATRLFETLWPSLAEQLASIPLPPEGAAPIRPQHEILEELVAGVRALDSRTRDVEEMVSGGRFRRGRFGRSGRIDPFLLEELAMRSMEGPRDPVRLLIVASLFRDDLPWLYELGMEAYRSAQAGSASEAHRQLVRFTRAVENALRGPLAEEMGIHPRELMMLLRESELLEQEDAPPDVLRAKSSRKHTDAAP